MHPRLSTHTGTAGKGAEEPQTAHRTPRTANCAPHTAHRAPRTAHHTPQTAHRTPHTAHRAPRTAHRAPHTAHRAPRTAHRAPRTAHRAWSGYKRAAHAQLARAHQPLEESLPALRGGACLYSVPPPMQARSAVRPRGDGFAPARKVMLTKIVRTLFITPTTVNVVAVTRLRKPKPDTHTAVRGVGGVPSWSVQHSK